MKIDINKIHFDFSKFTLPKVMKNKQPIKEEKEERKERYKIRPANVWIPTIYDMGKVEVNCNMKQIRYNGKIYKADYRPTVKHYVAMIRIYGVATFIHLTNDIIKRD